ncbi:MAG: hypothetical protein QNJ45_25310 [Ardenticatenaceae bacterium]|nr:hypothetical protein [Ardenticatenaceae bacterium]
MGRFASADTIVPDTKNPQAFNRYAYGYNNPVKFIDPSGHVSCPADLSEKECSPQANANDYNTIDLIPTRGWGAHIFEVPFTPTSSSDPRESKFVVAECVGEVGCGFDNLPVFKSNTPHAAERRPSGAKTLGAIAQVTGTVLDMRATGISGGFVMLQAAFAALGGPGPDDAIVAGAYRVADRIENAYSTWAFIFDATSDLLNGNSNIDLVTGQIRVGQDTLVGGATWAGGQFAGSVPFAGPSLDTAINLSVNTYDFGRLNGSTPTRAEGIIDSSGYYIILYPAP